MAKERRKIFGTALEYRVAWETNNGKRTTEWLTEYEARKKFNLLKNEVILTAIWAELIFASIDDDAEDEVVVIDSFTRPTTTTNGYTVIMGK